MIDELICYIEDNCQNGHWHFAGCYFHCILVLAITVMGWLESTVSTIGVDSPWKNTDSGRDLELLALGERS